MINNSKGAILVLTALLLPSLIAFWGWIISGALLLNAKITEQIAADSAVISGVEYAITKSNIYSFFYNIVTYPASTSATNNRTSVIFKFYDPSITPTINVTPVVYSQIFYSDVSLQSTKTKTLFIAPSATFTTSAEAYSKNYNIGSLSFISTLKPLS